jgi:phosphoribosylformylglycinamidine (FGAM) synthase-like enzyme
MLMWSFWKRAFPQWEFEAHWLPPESRGLTEPAINPPEDLGGLLLDLLGTSNLCSREWINRQYDHEVQGASVLKPFVGGRQEVPSEAAVLRPVLESPAGLAMAQVLLYEYGDIDTYHMVTASVEEGLRRVTAVGGDPLQVGGLDNFCWPTIQYDAKENPDGRYKAAQLVRACWGLKDACEALGIPLLSGKDSMYVDGRLKGRHGLVQRVSGPPTMLFTATAPVHDLKQAQTLEPKLANDAVYVLGQTKNELGASALYNLLDQVGRNVPETDLNASLAMCQKVAQALKKGLLASVCLIGRGGLGHALARMSMAADLGLEIDLDLLPKAKGLSPMAALFAESTGRFVVTVDPKRSAEFEALMAGLPIAQVGQVTRQRSLSVTAGEQAVVDLNVSQLRKAFTKRFGGMV